MDAAAAVDAGAAATAGNFVGAGAFMTGLALDLFSVAVFVGVAGAAGGNCARATLLSIDPLDGTASADTDEDTEGDTSDTIVPSFSFVSSIS
jgi:hypothetical protein